MNVLRRRYGRFIFGGGLAPKVGHSKKYKGWTIVVLSREPGVGGRGEFDILDSQGRRRGFAMTWRDALDSIDELQYDERSGHSHYDIMERRNIDEMVHAERAETVRAPRLTMKEQIEHDKRLRAVKEAERRRR